MLCDVRAPLEKIASERKKSNEPKKEKLETFFGHFSSFFFRPKCRLVLVSSEKTGCVFDSRTEAFFWVDLAKSSGRKVLFGFMITSLPFADLSQTPLTRSFGDRNDRRKREKKIND